MKYFKSNTESYTDVLKKKKALNFLKLSFLN